MIDPNAIIPGRKNYMKGVRNRTIIIESLKKNYILKTSEFARKLNLSSSCIRYHLNVLCNAKIVKKKGREWMLSKNIQWTIDDFL